MNRDSSENQVRVMKDFFCRDVDYWHGLYDGEGFLARHMADRKTIVLDLVRKYSNGTTLNMLDLGCGTGVLTMELLRQGHIVTALDCTKKMIDRLVLTVRESGFSTFLGAVKAYAQETSLFSDHFDGIICVGVFQYQLNDADLLREIGRILKKGGFCVFTIPNLLRLNYCLDPLYHLRFGKRIVRKVAHGTAGASQKNKVGSGLSGEIGSEAYPYSKKYFLWQLNSLISQHGLKVREIVGFGYGPLTLFGRQIVPDGISTTISHGLDRLAKKFRALNLVSNRWAFVVQKI
jgi:2-polyprenyl-3-methyl-5-hydroxy-6-metoxy-1,4-benzoquinol methylase